MISIEHIVERVHEGRDRIQVQPLPKSVWNEAHGIEDGSQELQDGEQVKNDVLQIAEAHVHGGGDQHEAEDKEELETDQDGQEQERRPEAHPGGEQEHAEQRQRQQEVDGVGQHGHYGQDLGRKLRSRDESGAIQDGRDALLERGGEPEPGEETGEQEGGVVFHVEAEVDREDQGVDQHEDQWVQERPDEPQHSAPVPQLELLGDQDANQLPMSVQGLSELQHGLSG